MKPRKDSYRTGVGMVQMLRLLEERSTGRMSVADLAEDLGVSERTVRRYADAIAENLQNEALQPLVLRELWRGRAAVRLNRPSASLGASIYQYAATWMAARVLGAEQHSLLSDSVGDVVERLDVHHRQGRDALAALMRQVFCYVSFGAKDYRDKEQILDRIVRATLRGRPTDIVYRRPGGEPRARRIEPFTIVLYRDGLYLLARTETSDGPAMRLFAIERIEGAAQDTTATFTRPKTFDPRRYFRNRIGVFIDEKDPEDVDVAFKPGAAAVARQRSWPGLAGWTEGEDGRWVLHLSVRTTPETVSWVLAWGDQVEVLKPEWLRVEVKGVLEKALEPYS